MIQKLKLSIIATMSVFAFLTMPVLLTSTAGAQIQDCVKQGSELNGQIGSEGCDDTTSTATESTDLTNAIRFIINVISVIVGVVAVIMVIFGGLRYITSGGDSGKVSSAKNTIIYAVIGLIVVALAQFIVQFVLVKTTDSFS
jgi:energy-converting hydrogenase Eha subunit B